jgi:[acyl-carrier-protein] S-malonyltransferase
MAGSVIALLFPGQGAQQVGMGKGLYDEFTIARRTFEEANDVLGYDLARICFEGPREDLMATRTCQPAILTTSVAVYRVAQEQGLDGDLTMGHSLGEYSALVASGLIDFHEALRLVERRGDVTEAVAMANPGSMAAILGGTEEDVEELCRQAGDVWPANFNCPGQVVASGLHRGVDRLLDLAHTRGLKGRLLDVDGAFHSAVMAPAAEKLRAALDKVSLPDTQTKPFLSATTAAFEQGERLRALLAQQLTAPVRFTQTVRAALDHGVDQFVELGPRSVLVGLVRRIRSDVETYHVGEPGDLPGLAELLRTS